MKLFLLLYHTIPYKVNISPLKKENRRKQKIAFSLCKNMITL